MSQFYDVIVIGGGHAGAEAAWAVSHLGAKVALITLDPARIAQMSCNPAIGGLAKGQMVREIDALGGLMGIASDNTGIQFRMLNRSKGPAVWGPRTQSDKYRYAREVQRLLHEYCANLTIIAGEVADIETKSSDCVSPVLSANSPSANLDSAANGSAHQPSLQPRSQVTAVRLADGSRLACRAVVVTTGTFLRALMHTGEAKTIGGRVGEAAATTLSGCLARLGLELGRLKTGTPPRLHRDTIDFSCFELQPGDTDPFPFSYLNEYPALQGKHWEPPLTQVPCHLSATNAQVHQLIRDNLHRAPMYSGQIASIGPRYCPSLEDKIVRFADKSAHHIFLEPEGLDTEEIYCNGLSTSLPADVQEQIIRLIPGLRDARILRYGYAVEYDMVWPNQIRSSLETKIVSGLFLAGQINGTSGYEEAAAQGLIAGVNATRYASHGQLAPCDESAFASDASAAANYIEDGEYRKNNRASLPNTPLILRRDQAYIGVLIDDLITKPPIEPYRMFTSRAEHRLHLRADNADQRLGPIGRQAGLVDDARWQQFCAIDNATQQTTQLLRNLYIGSGQSAYDYLRRSDTDWNKLVEQLPELVSIASPVARRIVITARYEGYIRRQNAEIARFNQLESKAIPHDTDYSIITGLRNEAKQKFKKFTPASLGQALRISGITPADITVLAIHLTSRDRNPAKNNSSIT